MRPSKPPEVVPVVSNTTREAFEQDAAEVAGKVAGTVADDADGASMAEANTEGSEGRTLPPPPLGEPLPRKTGPYVLVDRIARGGMADIFLAVKETELGWVRALVVKQILSNVSVDPRFEALFIDEARLCSVLHHPNVVSVFDLGKEDDRLYIVMEYVEGFDLHRFLRRMSTQRVALPSKFVFFFVLEALQGLDYAHRACDEHGEPLGIVHRDVSPSNVLISVEGDVKLCDFGIARATQQFYADAPSVQSLISSLIVGKSAYMSPEQATGCAATPQSDLYSIGVILWELCAGRRMIRGTEQEMLKLAQQGHAPPLPDRGLPGAKHLQGLIRKTLAHRPDDRWRDARDMADALSEYVSDHRLMTTSVELAQFIQTQLGHEIDTLREARERALRDYQQTRPRGDD
jgi:serine/threonine protein kinase